MANAVAAPALVLELPLPPRVLHPNSATGGFGRSRARKKARTDAYYAAYAVCGRNPPQWKQITARVIVRGVSAAMDTDGIIAWLKSTQDGIADLICPKGNDHGWTWESVRIEKGIPGLTVEIYVTP